MFLPIDYRRDENLDCMAVDFQLVERASSFQFQLSIICVLFPCSLLTFFQVLYLDVDVFFIFIVGLRVFFLLNLVFAVQFVFLVYLLFFFSHNKVLFA